MVSANTKPLSEFKTGEFVQIEKIQLEGTMKRRLLDLGFIPGAIIKVLQRSPLGDPVAYQVSNTTIALRKEESSLIFGVLIGDDFR
ncbi:TPA: ferrous iron transport protein A [Bacillus thuringiensis]|uniref:Ferrous iron transport protein A n=1 Tax=Bacillus thuringiensis serovar pingluonsis TaxID=180881 RepID=A0A243BNS5_BACTU|nr:MULTISPECIES: FeoA family protein [Bacillus cereus group]MEB9682828.1 FeoA family protein [Bacillus anthracis]OTY47953.1 ferrous iron transport protein A [Bacillus thuringiensis serovar pingluonsis]HDR8185554.1 ferrous iron transport protein A [Bacillus thuringiensis]